MMNILIVDDEPLARSRLRRMLGKVAGCEVVGEADSGAEAIKEAHELRPDLIFLDVRMPGMDGVEAATHLANMEPPPAVIFCTAYDEYAVQAFATQAVGYLLKPIRQAEIEGAILRAGRLNKAQLTDLPSADTDGQEGRSHVVSKSHRGMDVVPVDDVRLFQADQKYVRVFHGNGESLIDDTLKELEAEFANQFVRVHRNALVAIAHIEGLDRNLDGQYFVRLTGLDFRPQVSRRHVSGLRKLLSSN